MAIVYIVRLGNNHHNHCNHHTCSFYQSTFFSRSRIGLGYFRAFFTPTVPLEALSLPSCLSDLRDPLTGFLNLKPL